MKSKARLLRGDLFKAQVDALEQSPWGKMHGQQRSNRPSWIERHPNLNYEGHVLVRRSGKRAVYDSKEEKGENKVEEVVSDANKDEDRESEEEPENKEFNEEMDDGSNSIDNLEIESDLNNPAINRVIQIALMMALYLFNLRRESLELER